MTEIGKTKGSKWFSLKHKKKWLAIGLGVVLVCAGSIYAYEKMSASPATRSLTRTVAVERGDVTETVTASGTVQASRRVELSFSDDETTVSAIYVKVGDTVKQGQLLAKLDETKAAANVRDAQATLLSAQAELAEAKKPKTTAEMNALQAQVNQAKAALETAQKSYDQQKADNDLAKAKATLASAQKNYNTQKALYDAGAVSKSELDDAKDSLDQAQIEYDNAVLSKSQTQGEAKTSVESAQADYETALQELTDAKAGPDEATVLSAQAKVTQAQAQLDEAQKTLEDLTVKAPIDGIVTAIEGDVGEIPSNPFIVLDNSNADTLEVSAQISESDIGKVKEGLAATLTTSSYSDKQFSGKVTLVYPEATTDSGVTTYEVLLAVDNKEGLLKTGMTMNVTITVGTHQNVLYVPPAALQAQNGKDGVYLATASADGSTNKSGLAVPFKFQEVSTGYYSSDKVEITSGLNEGDQVVIVSSASSSTSSSNSKNSQMPGMGGVPGMGGMAPTGGGSTGRRN
ncbi:efflux RND transporter periplasmic adaptor subunit [Brevibacillus fulvus]|uniref:HlyD family secretion protein n=1 Tax=Brevibacillus fulvus TaxID=1125967 RepID=A0A938Y529_9BACL|nr:efflux RND transporter periplasmic adaptor subunit [Brevibacillus fulvus]MBM7591732.1 HlyD family secretion protein [Brevibacillus fulvus]